MSKNSVKNKSPHKEKKRETNKLVYIILFVVIFLLISSIVVKAIIDGISTDEVKKVKRIINTKYSKVECVDSYCNGIVAIKGNKLKNYTVELYNSEGKRVAKYNEKYNSNSKTVNTIYQISDKYFISKKRNVDNEDDVKYTINNKNGKEIYSSKNKLKILNDNFILMQEEKDSTDVYSILDTKGKKVFSNIKDIEIYDNGNIISMQIEDDSFILDEKCETILDNYTISKSIVDKTDNISYLIVKDIKNNVYNYFDIDKQKIVGDSFINFKKGDKDSEFIITKKENNKNITYLLKSNGKQQKIDEKRATSEIALEIKKKINQDKYYLYSSSIYKKDQKNILVDDLESKSFGILNIETNKFVQIYSYKADSSSFFSKVSKLNNNKNDLYLQISCTNYYCDVDKTIIYDFEHMKELYKLESPDLYMTKYTQYEDGYKVVKYSSSSQNKDYAGKYVLYDKDNKELIKNEDEIIVADKKLEFGDISNNSVLLYSVKKSKLISNNKLEKISIGDNIFYKLENNKKYTLYDENAKKVFSIDNGSFYNYSNSSILYLKNNSINIYNLEEHSTKNYKLKENENMNSSLGNVIPSYKGAIFINNQVDEYIKVINLKGRVIKKINNAQINEVIYNPKNKNIYIIVKKSTDNGNEYGLYIAK